MFSILIQSQSKHVLDGLIDIETVLIPWWFEDEQATLTQ